MTRQYVRVVCNIACKWEGLPPIYRIYLDDELFAERIWTWQDQIYLTEEIQIDAEPGQYQLKFELVPPHLAELFVGKPLVTYGTGSVDENSMLRIEHETA
jgi:hypothetical protein